MKSLVDLHCHLDGSLRPTTLVDLAEQVGVELPEDIRFTPGMGLQEALARFAVTLSVLQRPDAVERVAREMCEDAAAGGVRFAPQLHTQAGAAQEEIIDAALSGVDGRAGLLLCGLYGEPPSVLSKHVELARSRKGILGIDLAGGPSPQQDFSLSDYRAPFEEAAAAGIGRTVHAAEGRPPDEIRVALEVLGAQRIGHGTTLLEDEAVLDLVLSRDVFIEACLTSNLHTGAIKELAEHPLPVWLTRGVRCGVNTDNTLLSDVNSPGEWARAREIPGMNDELLELALKHAAEAAFVVR